MSSAENEIYTLCGTDGYEAVLPVDSADFSKMKFDGTPRCATWSPVLFQRFTRSDRGKRPLKESDFPWIGDGHSLVLRPAALEALQDILERSCEVLPLKTVDGVQLFITNTQVVRALDVEKSEIRRFPGSDKIMYVKRPVFVGELVRGLDFFRDEQVGIRSFVSGRFVERYNEKKLRGLTFEKVQTLD
ncbi:MAG: hypothetical protein RLZZ233_1116 [Verrucomicrobiota bacterium]|jgi:hypothetical protein